MKIDKYIADLLFVYDCVVIPGFGGFVGNYSTAQIKSSQHTFSPPIKQLAFNINLKTNDGLLAEHVSRNENITFFQASAIINQYVDALNMELKSNKKAEIEEVGTFVLDADENLQFAQNQQTNFLIDSFGLTSFQSPAIKRETGKKKFVKGLVDRPSIVPESPRVKIKKSWAVYFAIPLGLFMALSLYNNNIKKNVSEVYSSVNPFSAVENTYSARVKVASLAFNADSEGESESEFVLPVKQDMAIPEMKESSVNKEEVLTKALSVSSLNLALDSKISSVNMAQKKFHIIGGCFGSEENAKKLVSELKNKGFDSYILDQHNGLSRVSFGAFENKEEAIKILEKVKTTENENAWLFAR